MTKPNTSKKELGARIFLVLGLLAGCGLFGTCQIRAALQRSAMDEAVRNMRSFKYALDTFAMDNDGVYPSQDTADFYEVPNPRSSNQFFHQLYASGNTNSERILWIPRSQICNPVTPDDVTVTRGRFDPTETLQPGDNHWAYVADQSNVDRPNRPLIVEPYLPGTTGCDRRQWGGKALVTAIDSSSTYHDLDPHGSILDSYGDPLLDPKNVVWDGTPPSLHQPDPRP